MTTTPTKNTNTNVNVNKKGVGGDWSTDVPLDIPSQSLLSDHYNSSPDYETLKEVVKISQLVLQRTDQLQFDDQEEEEEEESMIFEGSVGKEYFDLLLNDFDGMKPEDFNEFSVVEEEEGEEGEGGGAISISGDREMDRMDSLGKRLEEINPYVDVVLGEGKKHNVNLKMKESETVQFSTQEGVTTVTIGRSPPKKKKKKKRTTVVKNTANGVTQDLFPDEFSKNVYFRGVELEQKKKKKKKKSVKKEERKVKREKKVKKRKKTAPFSPGLTKPVVFTPNSPRRIFEFGRFPEERTVQCNPYFMNTYQRHNMYLSPPFCRPFPSGSHYHHHLRGSCGLRKEEESETDDEETDDEETDGESYDDEELIEVLAKKKRKKYEDDDDYVPLKKKKVKKKQKTKKTREIFGNGRNFFSQNPCFTFPQKATNTKNLKILNGVQQKRRKDDENINEAMSKEEIGEVVRGFAVSLKPCRRTATGYARNVFPYLLCSRPYKYLLKVSWDDDLYKNVNLTFFTSKMEENLVTRVDKGVHCELKSTRRDGRKGIALFKIQFNTTSFCKRKQFKFHVENNGVEVFKSGLFKVIARKNKEYDDLFWDNFLVHDNCSKRKRNIKNTPRKRRKY